MPIPPPPTLGPNVGGSPLHIQIGPDSGHSLFVSIGAMTTERLGLRNAQGEIAVDITHPTGVNTDILTYFDQVLQVLVSERAHLGVQKNRLDFIIDNLEIQELNLSDAKSHIMDADMFLETMRFVRADVRRQAGLLVLAQSNQMQVSNSMLLINNMALPSNGEEYMVGRPVSQPG